VRIDDDLATESPLSAASVRLWEADPAIAEAGTPLDSIAPADLRTRRIAISAVEATGPRGLRIVPAEPLRKGRVYRIELALENRSGLPATPEGGRTFRPDYEGPAVWPSERVPLPEVELPPPDMSPPPEDTVPAQVDSPAAEGEP
jgi:hypothetical protein